MICSACDFRHDNKIDAGVYGEWSGLMLSEGLLHALTLILLHEQQHYVGVLLNEVLYFK